MIMANDLLTRPKSAFLFTDGVFYDQPKPEKVSRGFQHLGVLNYAFGIAFARKGDGMDGLTAEEIVDQKRQLEAFVGERPDTPRIMQADESSFEILDEIASYFVDQFPKDIEENLPRVIERPFWCGFTSPGVSYLFYTLPPPLTNQIRKQRCLNTDIETFPSGDFCKWVPRDPAKPLGQGRCFDQDFCEWTGKTQCRADPYCDWFGAKCKPRKP